MSIVVIQVTKFYVLDHGKFKESVTKSLRQRPSTGNSNMAVRFGYIATFFELVVVVNLTIDISVLSIAVPEISVLPVWASNAVV